MKGEQMAELIEETAQEVEQEDEEVIEEGDLTRGPRCDC
jgi:hypothetical protein